MLPYKAERDQSLSLAWTRRCLELERLDMAGVSIWMALQACKLGPEKTAGYTQHMNFHLLS
jgi:hypothetical protein